MKIKQVLDRRSDLSTFVIHLTRDYQGIQALTNLVSIIQHLTIEARSPLGIAKEMDEPANPSAQSQRVVSFTETPLEHIYSFFAELDEERQCKFKPYGIGLTKMQARKLDINPVWYIDKTPGTQWLHNPEDQYPPAPLTKLIIEAKRIGDFHSSSIAQITPYIEPIGTWGTHQREFWWEREWRHVGDFHFNVAQIAFGLCEEERITEFEKWVHSLYGTESQYPILRFIDPRWGLEEIIAHLAGKTKSDITPFSSG